jgi:23S rRNA pseudoU1915 N3-methylase RlmH
MNAGRPEKSKGETKNFLINNDLNVISLTDKKNNCNCKSNIEHKENKNIRKRLQEQQMAQTLAEKGFHANV